MSDTSTYQKAHSLEEIDNAVRLNLPIDATHPFFTDFSKVRGDFADKMIYRALNVSPKSLEFNIRVNQTNKTILFLAGMRGSGKTTELSKFAAKLHHPKAFFVVTCNIEDELDMNNLEYMDILIFQTENLLKALETTRIEPEAGIVKALAEWFAERVKEANKSIKSSGGVELEVKAETPSLFSFLKLTGKIKAGLTGEKTSADKIRSTFKNNFSDFSKKLNEFFETIAMQLRGASVAQDLLFIIDGLEKTGTRDIRKKIVIDEQERIRKIKVNTIFTLPIELIAERQRLEGFARVESFPFVKLQERDGTLVADAIAKFKDFTYKRIDKELFDNEETVERGILCSGGSPREYLRILEYALMYADDDKGIIDRQALEQGIKKLAATASQYVNEEELDKLCMLHKQNQKGLPVPFGADWQDMYEKNIVMEYNDGTYKRVNPILAESELYKHYVTNAATE